MSDITWVDLQKAIKHIFSESQVRKFKDIVQKDSNGYNWYLSFHDLRTRDSIVIHTKFIFKLTDDKKTLRKNEFLYLNDINCKYKIIKFENLGELEADINEILTQNMFGDDLISLSEFLIEPEREINSYFSSNNIEGYSVFEFEYYPNESIVACQNIVFEFDFNVNNNQDVKLIVNKNNKTYIYKFKSGGKVYTIKKNDLTDINKTIAVFIQKYLNNN